MRIITTLLLLLIIPTAVAAHPGGGLIALDANTVIFGDPAYNVIWRLEKGKSRKRLLRTFTRTSEVPGEWNLWARSSLKL